MSNLIKSCTFDDGVTIGIIETPMWPNRYYVGHIMRQRDEWLPMEATTTYHKELHEAFAAFRNDLMSHVMSVPTLKADNQLRCQHCGSATGNVSNYPVVNERMNLCRICASTFEGRWFSPSNDNHVISKAIARACNKAIELAKAGANK